MTSMIWPDGVWRPKSGRYGLGVGAIWRQFRRDHRDLAVRHARERAAFTAWVIEANHRLVHGDDPIMPPEGPWDAPSGGIFQ